MKSRNLIAATAMSLASSVALAAAPDTEAVEYYNVFTNH